MATLSQSNGTWTEGVEGAVYRINGIFMGTVYAHPGQRPYAATWDGRACVCKTVDAAKNWLVRQSEETR